MGEKRVPLAMWEGEECKTEYFYGRRGVVVITTAKLHSTKAELRFCADSNPADSASEICDGEDL